SNSLTNAAQRVRTQRSLGIALDPVQRLFHIVPGKGLLKVSEPLHPVRDARGCLPQLRANEPVFHAIASQPYLPGQVCQAAFAHAQRAEQEYLFAGTRRIERAGSPGSLERILAGTRQ